MTTELGGIDALHPVAWSTSPLHCKLQSECQPHRGGHVAKVANMTMKDHEIVYERYES